MLSQNFATLRKALIFIMGALILSGMAFINKYPLLFPDTYSYLTDGINLIRLKWPDNQRPVFYGLFIWLLHWEHTLWPVVLVQGLILTHLIWLTLRVHSAALSPLVFLGIIALLAILTPLSWYASHIMPDVFLGVLILSAFLVIFCRDQLRKGETIYLFLLWWPLFVFIFRICS